MGKKIKNFLILMMSIVLLSACSGKKEDSYVLEFNSISCEENVSQDTLDSVSAKYKKFTYVYYPDEHKILEKMSYEGKLVDDFSVNQYYLENYIVYSVVIEDGVKKYVKVGKYEEYTGPVLMVEFVEENNGQTYHVKFLSEKLD